MRRSLAAGTLVIMIPLVGFPRTAIAETAPPSDQKTLAATMNVYVFPTEGQEAEQQSKDEAECYSWAVQNTGSDPFDLQKQADQQEQATAEAKQQAQAATAEATTNFKKAFSVCLEAKKYLVKY